MAKRGPRDFNEPWTATRSPAWESAFKHGPPDIDGTPEDKAFANKQWEARRAQARDDAEWIIWGSRLQPPGVCVNLSGSVTTTDDRRILTMVKPGGFPPEAATHEDFARRIVACVNACAGIAKPETFIAEMRALLRDLLLNRTDTEDGRILSLLVRCIPPEEAKDYAEADPIDG